MFTYLLSGFAFFLYQYSLDLRAVQPYPFPVPFHQTPIFLYLAFACLFISLTMLFRLIVNVPKCRQIFTNWYYNHFINSPLDDGFKEKITFRKVNIVHYIYYDDEVEKTNEIPNNDPTLSADLRLTKVKTLW